MRLDEFRAALALPAPPGGLSAALAALWHDGRGDWDRAHRGVMDATGADAAWVHAYLHRKEGDLGNARYWYRKANKAEGTGVLEEEWEVIVQSLLAHG